MFEIILFFAVVILFVLYFNIKSKIERLESSLREVDAIQRSIMKVTTDATEVSAEEKAEEQVVPFSPENKYKTYPIDTRTEFVLTDKINDSSLKRDEIDIVDKIINWIKEDWLMKLGGFLLLIALGWFVSYAFVNNWVGPMGRITLGILTGTGILLVGWWRIQKYPSQGSIFTVVGSSTIILTVYAARFVYGYFTSESALFIMGLSAALVALMSIKFKRRVLSSAGLLLAGVAPLLVVSDEANYIGLFSYLLVIVLGSAWIMLLTERRELTLISLAIVSFYSLFPHLYPAGWDDKLILFAYAFAAIFFITNILGMLRVKQGKVLFDIVMSFGNGLFLLMWINLSVLFEWQSLVIVSWMLVFAGGAFIVFLKTKQVNFFYVYASVAVVYLVSATSVELHGETFAIALTVESAMIAIVIYLVLKNIRASLTSGLLFIGPMLLSLESMYTYNWRNNHFSDHFFVLVVLAICLLGVGGFFLQFTLNSEDEINRWLNKGYVIVGSLYILVILWLESNMLFRGQYLSVMLPLVVYTIIGISTYFYGMHSNMVVLKRYGGIMLGLVVLRLVFVEIWDMELVGRIITFFLIGILLMGTAFISRQKSSKLNSSDKNI